MIQKTEAIVLKRQEFRETSLILTLFTKDFGKIKGLAKGVRVPYPKWGTNFGLFSHNAIVFYEKKGLYLITEAELINSFREMLALNKNIVTSYLIELIDLIMPLEDKNERIFDLTLKTLHLLGKEKDLERIIYIFELKLLQLSGFTPRIDACVRCKKSIVRLAHFSNKWGGLLCQDCLNYDKKSLFINYGTISTLNHILHTSEQDLVSRLKMGRSIKDNLDLILKGFLAYHLERFPRSYAFLQKSLANS